MRVYVGGGGAMLLLEKWFFEHMNKLVEREAFTHSLSAELKDFCSRFSWFYGLLCCLSVGKDRRLSCCR